MIKACIFDMDGTVLDTLETIRYFVNITLSDYGISEISSEECKYFVGNGARVLIERIFASRGISDDARLESVLADYNAAYKGNPLYLTKPFDGIEKLFSELHGRGISVGIVSNKPHFVTLPISERIFGKSVDVTFGAREGVAMKPAPDAVREVMSLLGAAPSETVYVGDTSVDMKTGKNANAALTVGVLWGFRDREELLESGADVIVSSPSEILSEVIKLNA